MRELDGGSLRLLLFLEGATASGEHHGESDFVEEPVGRKVSHVTLVTRATKISI